MYKLLNIIFLTLLVSSHCYAASFECSKAKSAVEKAICSDSDLNNLDEQLSQTYKSALNTHPMPDYVKARQREWNKDNALCDKSKLVACLKTKYTQRIASLNKASLVRVYSNSEKFTYADGDAVAELWDESGKTYISLWGGFRIHRQASNDAGKPIYTGCEFEGVIPNLNAGQAIGANKVTLKFEASKNQISIKDDSVVCEGFGGITDVLTYRERINK